MNINNLIRTLKKKKIKISCAESCTGGLLASSITSIGGASKVFNLGLVTYSNQAKIKILKVNKNIIKKYGAVSHQCCISMVNNLSKISNANINISVTGIAGPKGGTKQKPVGLVYIGIKKGNPEILVFLNDFISKLVNEGFIESLLKKHKVQNKLSIPKIY